MLVLSRQRGESIVIGNVTVTVVRIDGDKVRIGITADRSIPVLREELLSKGKKP